MFAMQLYGVPRAERQARALRSLLARFRLSEKRDVPFAKLSRGMKRALTIAAALAHRPPLLFPGRADYRPGRDERAQPATDDRRLRNEGVTIFLTTHYLEEAERLCDRLAIIVKGASWRWTRWTG
jgi:ABC-2 type transport system ATP-binding protein